MRFGGLYCGFCCLFTVCVSLLCLWDDGCGLLLFNYIVIVL